MEALSPWRMELRERADGLVVVNDAYNANPDSMRAALTTLAEIGRRSGSRTVAVLGEMRELGDTSEEEHRALGHLATSSRSTTWSWSASSPGDRRNRACGILLRVGGGSSGRVREQCPGAPTSSW